MFVSTCKFQILNRWTQGNQCWTIRPEGQNTQRIYRVFQSQSENKYKKYKLIRCSEDDQYLNILNFKQRYYKVNPLKVPN